MATGDAQAGVLWKEYARGISGKQRVSWSSALRGLGLTEADERWRGELVWAVPPEEWAERIRPDADSRGALLVRARRA